MFDMRRIDTVGQFDKKNFFWFPGNRRAYCFRLQVKICYNLCGTASIVKCAFQCLTNVLVLLINTNIYMSSLNWCFITEISLSCLSTTC